MRIGINLIPYNPGGQGGAEVYLRNLVHGLGSLEEKHTYILFMNPVGAQLYAFGKQFHEIVVPISGRRQVTRSIAEQVLLPYYEKQLKLDVLFSNYVIPFTPGGCARIVNVHDMLYNRYPHFLPVSKRWWWRTAIPLSIRRSDVVLTVSHASEAEIIATFPETASRIMVQSEGVDLELQAQRPGDASIESTLRKLNLRRPLLLSAATFGPQKNMMRLLEAFQLVRSRFPQISLALTGRAGRFAGTVPSQLLEGVSLTGYLHISELADLYASAELHILPSIFEGFGLSILEAQYFGCPVATSNVSATAEVGGKSVALFDPLDVQSIAHTIISLLEDEHERTTLIELGRSNLERYSWSLAAKQFLEACQQARNGHSPQPLAARLGSQDLRFL